MRSKCCLLFIDAGVWQIAQGEGPTCSMIAAEAGVEAEAGDAAAAIARALAAGGYNGESVVLGLDSASCLAVEFPADDSRRTSGRTSLLYELEQWLPLAAEDLSADFVFHRGHVLGIAVETAPVARLVEALEAHGIAVQSISPLAMLTLQTLVTSIAGEPGDVVMWKQGERLELFQLVEGQAIRWRSIPAEPAALRQNLTMFCDGREMPLQVVAWQPDELLGETLREVAGIEWRDGQLKRCQERS